MLIYIAADHNGFKLKEYLKNVLKQEGYEAVDVGNEIYDENDDYPDIAKDLAYQVSLNHENARGIILCGSGAGVSIVVNKFPRIRGVLGASADQVYDSRTDDDTNVLALAADFIEAEEAKKIVLTWLATPFSGEERHKRRLKKIDDLELAMIHLPEREE